MSKTKATSKRPQPAGFDEGLAMVLVQSLVDAVESLTSRVEELTAAVRGLRRVDEDEY